MRRRVVLGERLEVMPRADEAALLRAPEGEPDRRAGSGSLASRRAASRTAAEPLALSFMPGPFRHAVEMGADTMCSAPSPGTGARAITLRVGRCPVSTSTPGAPGCVRAPATARAAGPPPS